MIIRKIPSFTTLFYVFTQLKDKLGFLCYTDTMAFNRNRNDSRGGVGFRPRFGDRGDRGPVTMHRAICDNCGKECEVPFRPTSGKPIFCSSCFENKGGSESRRFEGRDSGRS